MLKTLKQVLFLVYERERVHKKPVDSKVDSIVYDRSSYILDRVEK